MIIESIITQIGPQVFLQGVTVSEYNYVYDVRDVRFILVLAVLGI